MILLAAAAIGLFGCGEDTSNDNPLPTKPVEEKKASNETSVVRISGAENFEFEQKVVFGCVNDLIHIQTFTQSPKFSLYLPADVTPGTYELADFNANSNVSYVPGKAVVAVSGKMAGEWMNIRCIVERRLLVFVLQLLMLCDHTAATLALRRTDVAFLLLSQLPVFSAAALPECVPMLGQLFAVHPPAGRLSCARQPRACASRGKSVNEAIHVPGL